MARGLTVTEMPAIKDPAADRAGPGVVYQGVIAIEWPEPKPIRRHGVLPLQGWATAVYDALSGKQIMTVTGVEIHVTANGIVTADVTMFADEDGQPLYQLEKSQHKGIAEGTWPFLVAEMRVRKAEPPRAALEPKFTEPAQPEPAELVS